MMAISGHNQHSYHDSSEQAKYITSVHNTRQSTEVLRIFHFAWLPDTEQGNVEKVLLADFVCFNGWSDSVPLLPAPLTIQSLPHPRLDDAYLLSLRSMWYLSYYSTLISNLSDNLTFLFSRAFFFLYLNPCGFFFVLFLRERKRERESKLTFVSNEGGGAKGEGDGES